MGNGDTKWIEWSHRLHQVTGTLALKQSHAPLAEMAAQLIAVAYEMEEVLIAQAYEMSDGS